MNLQDILEDHNRWWCEPSARGAGDRTFRRPLQRTVVERLGRDDRRALLVLGPRQVGKTVLLRQTADDLLDQGLPATSVTYFDFSDSRITKQLSVREVVASLPPAAAVPVRFLLLDEISRAENWDLWLKQVVDEGGLRVVATDSAASVLAHGGRESGQGRWDEYKLETLTFSEFAALNAAEGEAVEKAIARTPNLLERYLALGGFPEHARSEDYPKVRERLRKDITERAILRDLVRLDLDLERVRRLFAYLVQSAGSIWNASDRADDLRAHRRTVGEWLQALEDTALLVSLDQNTGSKASSRLRARPKIYAADHGLVNAFVGDPLRREEVRPKVFETVVFRHLRELVPRREAQLSYLRLKRLELDFVLDVGGRRIGVEVTTSRALNSDRWASLQSAAKKLGLDAMFLVYDGLIDGAVTSADESKISCLSLGSFLRNPEQILGRQNG